MDLISKLLIVIGLTHSNSLVLPMSPVSRLSLYYIAVFPRAGDNDEKKDSEPGSDNIAKSNRSTNP